ncbi:hypothetical protein LTR37_008504 [Vermiconidia calcicola]|uniref:Uncharacterized protein n=1 Tax=Vermiconidia calcicola TaxID=1690605 RepID=A0ACC3NAQ7_9PEZI|nr:hypothetical protein LTR37_008504 [Vermiconidia calcicola]
MAGKALYAASAAALFSTAAVANQFVMYSPGGDDSAVERMDAILYPNAIAGHVHQIFGASGSSPDMTYESLQESNSTTVGSAGFEGNAADHSVYWHPALYMEANDGSGYIRVPMNGHTLYYFDIGEGKKREPFEFPHGFRMVGGDSTLRAPADNPMITTWKCSTGGSYNFGDDGGFPTGVSTCSDYTNLFNSVEFPHCWNGNDFDQEDPGAHMAYPEGDARSGSCPSSHPIRLPHIFMKNFFNIDEIADKVKPDSFTLSQGDKTGFGSHADFYNGWEDGAIPALFEQCPQPEYGNMDVGTCPNFESSGPATDCILEVTYKEEVDRPGNHLPGCNPIVDISPAPKMAPAALGEATDKCKAGSSSGGGSSEPSSAVPQSSSYGSDESSSVAPASDSAPAAIPSSSSAPMSGSAPAAIPSYAPASAASAPAPPGSYGSPGAATTVTTFTTFTASPSPANEPGTWDNGRPWKGGKHRHRHHGYPHGRPSW